MGLVRPCDHQVTSSRASSRRSAEGQEVKGDPQVKWEALYKVNLAPQHLLSRIQALILLPKRILLIQLICPTIDRHGSSSGEPSPCMEDSGMQRSLEQNKSFVRISRQSLHLPAILPAIRNSVQAPPVPPAEEAAGPWPPADLRLTRTPWHAHSTRYTSITRVHESVDERV